MAAPLCLRRGNDALRQHMPRRLGAVRMRELTFAAAQIIPGPVERGRHDTDIVLIEHADRSLHVVTRRFGHFWWRASNAAQQKLFRTANLQCAVKQSDQDRGTLFPLAVG
jgi:hypothetical protein